MEKSMRLCEGFVMARLNGKWEKAEFKKGKFHAWGVNSEEFESGPANNTIAIVELEDGSIITPYPNDIKFLTLQNKKEV